MTDDWTFLTKHAAVLLVLSATPDATLDEIAAGAALSHRWTVKVVNDLLDAGYVTRKRAGRSYTYVVDITAPLRLDVVHHAHVERLTSLLEASDDDSAHSDRRDELATQLRSLRSEIAREQQHLQQLTNTRARLERALTAAQAALASLSSAQQSTEP